MAELIKDPETGRFLPGNIGPGRPKGARNKLSEAFIQALQEDFEDNGAAAIQVVRAEKPDQYLKVIASLCSKDVNLNINNEAEELSDDELRSRVSALARRLAQFVGGTDGDGSGVEAQGGSQFPSHLH